MEIRLTNLRLKTFIKLDSSLSIRLSIKTKIATGFQKSQLQGFLEWWGLQRAREFREPYKRLGKHKQTNLRSVVCAGYPSHAPECWDSLQKHYQLPVVASNYMDNTKQGLEICTNLMWLLLHKWIVLLIIIIAFSLEFHWCKRKNIVIHIK